MLRMLLIVAGVRGTQYVMKKIAERRDDAAKEKAMTEKLFKDACEKAKQENNL